MAGEAASLRAVSKTGRGVIRIVAGRSAVSAGEVDEADTPALRTMLRAVLTENHRLKAELAELAKSKTGEPAKVDRPLTTRERRTLLVIIAALLSHAGTDYRKQKAARELIERATTKDIDTRVGDETIRRIVSEIEGALLSRRQST
jgi:endonuclease III